MHRFCGRTVDGNRQEVERAPLNRTARSVAVIAPDRLDELIELLGRAGMPREVSQANELRLQLEADVLSVIHATGLAHDGSEDGILWHELASEQTRHDELELAFRAMANAPNPLDPRVCKPELLAELDAQIRVRLEPQWKRQRRNATPSVKTLNWDTSSDAERELVRSVARNLAQWHRSQIRRGPRQKFALDTAMMCLADIFLRYSGDASARHRVPYAPASHFIRFAVLALEPAAMYFEVSPKALSRRWERIVIEDRRHDSAEDEAEENSD